MAIVDLLFVSKGSKIGLKKVWLASHSSREGDWGDAASVVWLLYVNLYDDALDVPAREITTCRRTVSNIQVRKWVGAVSVVFRPGH